MSEATDTDGTTRAQPLLDAWREQGRDAFDPVRFHFMVALARRAAALGGDARRLLEEKLNVLVEAYAADLANAKSTPDEPRNEPTRSPLSALTEYVAASHTTSAQSDNENPSPQPRTYPELDTLDYFREVWSRVRTHKQLRESFEQVPGNAGPLNSSSLVHRSLSLMRELSPGYLQQFLSYVEALSWMEQMTGDGIATDKDAPRAAGASNSANASKSTTKTAAAKRTPRGKTR